MGQPLNQSYAAIVSLLPHDCVVRIDGRDIVIPPSGQVARVAATAREVATVGEIPIVVTEFGEITGLPEPQSGVLYLTSTLVAQAAARLGRADVVSPDTGPTAIREGGQVVAVIRLQTFAEEGRRKITMTNTMKRTYWDVWYQNAPMERGWLFVETGPYDKAKAHQYTYLDCPVVDDRSSTGWREQSALGWYLRYTEAQGPQGETVYAVIRGRSSHVTQWCHSAQQAREWIEKTTRNAH